MSTNHDFGISRTNSGRTQGVIQSPARIKRCATRAMHSSSDAARGMARSPASHCCMVRRLAWQSSAARAWVIAASSIRARSSAGGKKGAFAPARLGWFVITSDDFVAFDFPVQLVEAFGGVDSVLGLVVVSQQGVVANFDAGRELNPAVVHQAICEVAVFALDLGHSLFANLGHSLFASQVAFGAHFSSFAHFARGTAGCNRCIHELKYTRIERNCKNFFH